MRRRILLGIVGVTILATIVLSIPLGIIISIRENNDAFLELDRIAERAGAGVSPDLRSRGGAIELPRVERNVAVAVYDPDGAKVTGTGPERADRVTSDARDVSVFGSDASSHIVARPIVIDERRIGTIRVAEPLGETRSRVRNDLLVLGAIDVGAVLTAALVGLIVASRLVRPLRRIHDDAVRLGNGDFSIHPTPSGVTELDETADALAETARRLDSALMRERAFSSDASHQLRTPLTAMRLAIETEMITPRTRRTEVLHESLAELDRLETTIETLLAVARDRPLHREPLDVSLVAAGVRRRWNGALAARARGLHVATHGQPAAHVSRDVLDQILDVLLDNAVKHGEGEVAVTISDEASNLLVTVSDEGAIDPDRTAMFVRRDPAAGGHGVGLSLARSLAEAEGGRLALATSDPATFRLVLPDLG